MNNYKSVNVIKCNNIDTNSITDSVCVLLPSPSFALLIRNCDVIALVENIQQGPRGEMHKVMNKAFNQTSEKENTYATALTVSYLYLCSMLDIHP